MRPIIRKPLTKVPDLPGEIWKDVPNWEGLYMASNLSRVKSLMGWLGSEKILKQPLKAGYPSVTFWENGKGEQWLVHRLVMKMFKDNPDNLPEVDHLYGDRTDTRLEHLEYVTRSENIKRAYKIGLAKIVTGEKHWRSKLKNSEVLDIFNSELSFKELSEKYNISLSHIGCIKSGSKRSSLTGKKYEGVKIKRLSEETVISIYYAEGSLRKIASEFEVCFATARAIKRGHYHKEIINKLK